MLIIVVLACAKVFVDKLLPLGYSCSLICAENFYLSLIITNFIIISNKLMRVSHLNLSWGH